MAAIVPHWGEWETTEVAIRAVIDSTRPPDAAIVVDNHPGDRRGLGAAVARLGHGAPFDLDAVSLPDNLGYLGGAMRAIERLRAASGHFDLYWILNNDARPRPEALDALLRCSQLPDTAIVSCSVLDRGRQPPPLVYSPWRGAFSAQAGAGGRRLGIEGVSGASFLLTDAFLSRIGRLPEHLFLFFEEVWLAWAAHAASMRVIACPASVVDHESEAAISLMGRSGTLREYLNTRARLALTVEWRPECLLTVVPLTALRAAGEALNGRRSMARAILAGLADGVRLRLPRVESLGNARLSARASMRTFRRQSRLRRLLASH